MAPLEARGKPDYLKGMVATPSSQKTEELRVEPDPIPAIWEAHPSTTPDPTLALPEHVRPTVLIDSIHGGDIIPARFAESLGQLADGDVTKCQAMQAAYATEKDWGADQVARMLSAKLGLAGCWRVRVARCLMDFGRFPGVTNPGASHLSRFAINDPSARFLSHDQKRDLLASFFDPISTTLEGLVPGRRLKIAVHTYDRLNDTGTERPLVSLIYRSQSYQTLNRMPYNVFDPTYPDHLGEFSVDRRLVARISLELEKKGVTVAYNHPYALPEGSVEIRSQVWFFFNFVRRRFFEAYPDCVDDPHYTAVFAMLMDTNLRDARSGMLRDFLHLFRTVRPDRQAFFHTCGDAYERIARFIKEHRMSDAYRRDPDRPSSLAIEVRKDFVWQFADAYCREPILGPGGARLDNIDLITTELARAISTYFREDRAPDPDLIPEGRPPRAR